MKRVALLCLFVAAANSRVEAQLIDEARLTFERNLEAIERLSVPFELRRALANSIPSRVRITGYQQHGATVRIAGTAERYDDVSEFLKGLSDMVECPWGFARVLERRKDPRDPRVPI